MASGSQFPWSLAMLWEMVEALMPRCLSGSKSNALRRWAHGRWVLFAGIDIQELSRHLLSFFQIFQVHCAFSSATLFPLPGNLIPCFADVGNVGMLWSKRGVRIQQEWQTFPNEKLIICRFPASSIHFQTFSLSKDFHKLVSYMARRSEAPPLYATRVLEINPGGVDLACPSHRFTRSLVQILFLLTGELEHWYHESWKKSYFENSQPKVLKNAGTGNDWKRILSFWKGALVGYMSSKHLGDLPGKSFNWPQHRQWRGASHHSCVPQEVTGMYSYHSCRATSWGVSNNCCVEWTAWWKS